MRRFFAGRHNSFPALIPVESAGAIADVEGAYESFDIPQGTLRGSPPVPDADLTTLRVGSYLVANKKIDPDTITTLTQALVTARNDLVRDQPLLAGLTAPDTDPGAYIPVHPGAAAYYNGTQQSFMDKYGNWIYLTPMVLGALASIFATAWRFLGVRQEPADTTLRSLFALPRRIREVKSEAELTEIENQVDQALDAEMANAIRSENAQDISTLVSMAHRLEDSIHRRRQMLAARPAATGLAGIREGALPLPLAGEGGVGVYPRAHVGESPHPALRADLPRKRERCTEPAARRFRQIFR